MGLTASPLVLFHTAVRAYIHNLFIFAGSISDCQLFQESGILDLLGDVPEGKFLMADRGCEIQDLLVKFYNLLNIPPFLGSQSHLSEKDVKTTQKIARLRIHVEQAIGKVKSRFRVFQSSIPLTLVGSANQTWSVAFLLTIFCGPLITSNEEP